MAILLAGGNPLRAQESGGAASGQGKLHPIDLPTVLRLAGAQNLDVQIAHQRVAEAKANHEAARLQFFPWLSPGLSYRRHDGQIQAVDGTVLGVSKQSYTVGGTITAQVELGDAYYKTLAALQRRKAAESALEAGQLQSILSAARQYFDLVNAQAQAVVAEEAVRIATEHRDQLDRAVEAGIAFRGDLHRVQVQTERSQLALRKVREQKRVIAARLAQTLDLDSTIELTTPEIELAPLTLIPLESALDSLVAQALGQRPELRQNEALVRAAREEKKGSVYGPLVPGIGAQAFIGGLGGGKGGATGNFDDSQDYQVTVAWRVGPGGLFDQSRVRAANSRLEIARLGSEKMEDGVVREVVEAHTRVQSLSDQMATARRALTAAEETLNLTRDRREFGVGAVLEHIQAQQELTNVRNDYLSAVAEFNKAQYSLAAAVGQLHTSANSGN